MELDTKEKFYLNLSDITHDLLKYADDYTIETFLNYINQELNGKLEKDLFFLDDLPPKRKLLYTIIVSARSVLIHLNSLELCYGSYKDRFADFDDDNYALSFIKDTLGNDSQPGKVTDNKKEMLFRLIVENYKENKFYYRFGGSTLDKIEIKNLGKKSFNYCITEYPSTKVNGKTIIKNKATNDKHSISKSLDFPMDQDRIVKEEDFRPFFEDMTTPYSSSYYKDLHNQIVNILKNDRKNYCNCCNPNRIKNSRAICDNCKNTFDEFDYLNQQIEDWKQYDDTFRANSIDYKQIVYSRKNRLLKRNNLQLRKQLKICLLDSFKSIEKEIAKETNMSEQKRIALIKESINKLKTEFIPKSFD